MPKAPDPIVLCLLGVVAAGLLAVAFRSPVVLRSLERVIVLFPLSGIGAGAFLIGRAQAHRRRNRRHLPPPPDP